MNYYEEIKKDYSKERNTVNTYFEIGRLLTEAGGKYGDNIIDEYSKRLVVEVGKKYNTKTLYKMKQLFKIFSDEKVAPLVRQLSWSNCLLLIPLRNYDEINYYANECIKYNLTKRQLDEKIKSKEYERLSESAKTKLITNEKPLLHDLVKNPILIKSLNKYNEISEKILQQIILEDIESFMKELGSCFCFIGKEYPIKIGSNYNYIDLLLYNL